MLTEFRANPREDPFKVLRRSNKSFREEKWNMLYDKCIVHADEDKDADAEQT